MSRFFKCNAERRYAKSRYAESHGTLLFDPFAGLDVLHFNKLNSIKADGMSCRKTKDLRSKDSNKNWLKLFLAIVFLLVAVAQTGLVR